MQIFSSLSGAGFTLLCAYALGLAALRRSKAPFEIALALGAAAGSTLVFLLLLANAANRWTFLAIGIAACGVSWKELSRRRRPGQGDISIRWGEGGGLKLAYLPHATLCRESEA